MSPQNFKAEVQRLNFLREKQKKQGLKRGLLAVKGATVQNSATSTEDMNYMQLLDFAENMIIRTFRVPPQLYGKIDTANLGSGSGDSQRKDWKTTFEGESTIVENAFNKTLKYYGFNERFNYGKIDVIDELYDAQVDQILVSTGIKTRDEARNERGLDKITNSWAGYYR
jgi:capsid portal protein